MLAENVHAFIMQEQPHVLRYVALGVGIAAAGLGVFFYTRSRKSKTASKP